MLTFAILNARSDTPQRVLLGGRDEVRAALLGVLGAAQREVRIMARDLSVFALDQREIIATFEQLLVSNRRARARLDPLDVVGQQPHALQIRVAAHEDAVGDEACLLVDSDTSLRLEHTARARGEVWLHNETRLQPLGAIFERRWDAAAHDLAVAPLGL